VEKYQPSLKGYMSTNASGALGQGITMAEAIGADTVDMDQIQIHPTVTTTDAHLITEGLRGDGAILVNMEGNRFTDEVGTRDAVSKAEIAQTGSQVYLVIDNKMVEKSAVIQGYIKSGYTVTGNDAKSLAEAMGVPAEAFENTLKNWNEAVEKKEDAEFGRTSFAA
ncbi:FAD-binding protein, partial [Oribacterium parvum]